MSEDNIHAVKTPDSYVIDVCMTCGRHAVYPFGCGHRSVSERWTVPITVVPTAASKTVLKTIAENAGTQ